MYNNSFTTPKCNHNFEDNFLLFFVVYCSINGVHAIGLSRNFETRGADVITESDVTTIEWRVKDIVKQSSVSCRKWARKKPRQISKQFLNSNVSKISASGEPKYRANENAHVPKLGEYLRRIRKEEKYKIKNEYGKVFSFPRVYCHPKNGIRVSDMLVRESRKCKFQTLGIKNFLSILNHFLLLRF